MSHSRDHFEQPAAALPAMSSSYALSAAALMDSGIASSHVAVLTLVSAVFGYCMCRDLVDAHCATTAGNHAMLLPDHVPNFTVWSMPGAGSFGIYPAHHLRVRVDIPLEAWEGLLDDGLLTAAEFEQKRVQILEDL